MSSIIKGERIRNQSVINLSERFKAIHIEYEKAEIENEALDSINSNHVTNGLHEMPSTFEQETVHEVVNEPLVDSQQKRDEILLEAHQMAQQIVEEAKQHAEEILSGALAKAEELKEDTRAKQTQLLYETQTKTEIILEEATKEAEKIKKQAYEEKETLIKSSEDELTEVLQKLLGHIISEELFENTQWLKCLVGKMLQECPTKEEIKIYVSVKVFEELTESTKESIQALGDQVILEVKSTLSDTTCIVETKQGNIVYDVIEGMERVISEIKILQKLS